MIENLVRQDYSRYFGIKWPEQLRCLGIYLGYDDQLYDKKTLMNMWMRLRISSVSGIIET